MSSENIEEVPSDTEEAQESPIPDLTLVELRELRDRLHQWDAERRRYRLPDAKGLIRLHRLRRRIARWTAAAYTRLSPRARYAFAELVGGVLDGIQSGSGALDGFVVRAIGKLEEVALQSAYTERGQAVIAPLYNDDDFRILMRRVLYHAFQQLGTTQQESGLRALHRYANNIDQLHNLDMDIEEALLRAEEIEQGKKS